MTTFCPGCECADGERFSSTGTKRLDNGADTAAGDIGLQLARD
jgi:hypothetical protein